MHANSDRSSLPSSYTQIKLTNTNTWNSLNKWVIICATWTDAATNSLLSRGVYATIPQKPTILKKNLCIRQSLFNLAKKHSATSYMIHIRRKTNPVLHLKKILLHIQKRRNIHQKNQISLEQYGESRNTLYVSNPAYLPTSLQMLVPAFSSRNALKHLAKTPVIFYLAFITRA